MAIGKGYFWSGLSEGVRSLYGSMQNERMANEAQAARRQENMEDNAAKMSQIKAAMGAKPGPDLLNNDYDSVLVSLKNAQKALADHDSDFMGKSQNPSGWAQEHAALAKNASDLAATEAGLRKQVATRHNVNSAPAPASNKKSEFLNAIRQNLGGK